MFKQFYLIYPVWSQEPLESKWTKLCSSQSATILNLCIQEHHIPFLSAQPAASLYNSEPVIAWITPWLSQTTPARLDTLCSNEWKYRTCTL